MPTLILNFTHIMATIARLLRPDGAKALVAENLLLKKQLLIINRSRNRAPNLSPVDRLLLGFGSLFIHPRCLMRSAIILKRSTILGFHRALRKQNFGCSTPVPGELLIRHL